MPLPRSQAWAEAAALTPTNEEMLIALELQHSAFKEFGTITPIRVVRNNEDMTFKIESSARYNPDERVEFIGMAFGIEFPRLDKLGVEAPIWIENAGNEVSKYLPATRETNEPVIVIVRGYLASDPDTVGYGPFSLKLRNIKRKNARLTGSLIVDDPTKMRFLRQIYDTKRFPSLIASYVT